MHSTKNNGLAAANNHPAKTLADHANARYFDTEALRRKALAKLEKSLGLLGFHVHILPDKSYLVTKLAFSYHAENLSSLCKFVQILGAVK
jgi:hypothetical protein